ncbi:MAG TPA: sigma-54 dependent transcriptional regulator [Blastocatellia bacterium]|nr:sigma-54 dependent transcriptional regulator [Blastocatellia bacterium]
MPRNKILLVEDEAGIRFGIQNFLDMHGYEVNWAETCKEALDSYKNCRPDAVMTDYMLPDGNALDLLPRLKEIDSGTPIIILTGHGSIDTAVRAIKEGAEHFLTKPVELPSLLVILQRLLENQRIRQKQLAGKTKQARQVINPFLGTSGVIGRLAEDAKRVLAAESPVLILGETGTGKSVLASWLHYNGPRAEEAFVDMNCAGLSRELLESELFGHEKGAFTGATASKVGLLEVAHRGTVLLDEMGDMDPLIQPKLLKVLEEKRFRRVGEVRDRQVDIRLIAATHQDLQALVRDKKFRSDLYFRINTIQLTVPSLRDRTEDIPLLSGYLLEKIAADMGRSEIQLSVEAQRALQAYPWPGNIRELRNALERAMLLSEGNMILLQDLRFDISSSHNETSTEWDNLTLTELEHRYIAKVLKEEQGNVERAAKRLDIPRSSLYQKIKRYHIILTKA